MKTIYNLISFILIIECTLVVEINTQRSGIGLFQTAMDSAMTTRESIIDTGDTYLKKLIPSSTEETSQDKTASSEMGQRESSTNASDNGLLPNIIDALKGMKLPDVPSLLSNNDSSSGILPTKTGQGYIDDLTNPAKKAGADIVEGAVKTGVDQAMTSITDSFKIDIALVVAVLVIQVILFVCGAHLCYYVYQREREMQTYVKQQITLTRSP